MLAPRLGFCFASLLSAAVTGLTGVAAAQGVSQPAPFTVDGQLFTMVPIDQELSGDYFDPARFNATTLGLGSLFTALGEAIDYRADASVEPSVFAPLCGLSGQMILRGGGCRMDFGWYCVDDPTTFVPLVTSAEVLAYHDANTTTGNWTQYANNDKSFVPVIGMPPVAGAPLEDVQNHPVFQNCPSKQIGFTIKPVDGVEGYIPTENGPVCTQQKFSQPSLNMKHTATGLPWVSAVTYASKRAPGVFYIAFEDLPSSGETFNPPYTSTSGAKWVADGDFNDFVYRVQGIQCKGGGLRCDTGLPGICSIGITECTIDGTPGACTQKFQPSLEVCNNIDDDCDGVVDVGEGVCPDPSLPICFEGQCVATCSGGEFACPDGYSCESRSNSCVENACLGVVCGEGQYCRQGACRGGCEGVVCPSGQDCLFGQCVDLCQGISCPDGFVCSAGACIADCKCLPCGEGLSCGADGKCVDTACIGIACPEGQICERGVCGDPCLEVTCPPGQACLPGRGCVPTEGSGGADGAGGTVIIIASGGTGPILPGMGGAGTAAGPGLAAPEGSSGCGCQLASRGGSAAGLTALLLLGLGLVRRRRADPR